MQLDTTDVGPCKKTLKFVLSASDVDEALTEKYDEIIKTVPVPGFRVGKAPDHLIEKRFGELIAKEVTAKLIQDSFEKSQEEHEWPVIGDPEFDVPEEPVARGADFSFSVTFETRPEFELVDLSQLEASDPFEPASDADVERTCAEQARRLAALEDVAEGASAGEDSVVTCRLSACAIEDGDEQEFYASDSVDIDVGRPGIPHLELPELGAALTGKKVDDRGELSFTVPDTFPEEEWRGLPGSVVFEVLKIRKQVVPDLAQVAEKIGIGSEQALRDMVRGNLDEMKRKQANEQIEEVLVGKLLDAHQFDLPEGIVASTAHGIFHERFGKGSEPDERSDEWKGVLEDAAKEIKTFFLLDAIADEELIYVGEADIDRHISQMARQMGATPEVARRFYEESGMISELRHRIRSEKTKAVLRQRATIAPAR